MTFVERRVAGRGRAGVDWPFHRHPGNPILTAADLAYDANTVFNAAATLLASGETLMLMRVEDRRGHSHLTAARSRDGVGEWQIDGAPTMPAAPAEHPEELWGIEDPRITWVEDQQCYYIVYTAYSVAGPLVSLATTTDFVTFARLGPVMPPDDKDAALFPVRFDGRYAMLHRPSPTSTGGAHIWLSYSTDMTHWGDHQILLRARLGSWWDANKIGLSTPPLLTDEGWLMLYHGVHQTIAGGIYRLGLALLDRDDPRKVLLRGDEWIFGPREAYERQGDVADVVFPCGWVTVGVELRMYYGAADTSMALATAKVSYLLAWLHDHSRG